VTVTRVGNPQQVLFGLCVAFVLLLSGSFGHAQRGRHVPDFHGRDFGHFSLGERNVWQGGRWVHDWHAGRYGWW